MSNAGSTISISDLYALVKTYDKKFSPKPVNPALLNEDGTPLVVYHGTDADFTVFDRTKGRSNMDIQGMFFSPWEIDAQGYGPKVGAYYINLKNPADEGTAFKALNMFQGQNGAGINLIKQGYDGVNNSGEEFIAFYPEQIKSATDNIGTFDSDNPDIRYSTREEEVDSEERKVYNRKGAYKRISKEEYAIISSRIMEDNSKYIARNQELPRYGTARSADYFYLYENFTPGNFGVLKQIKITDANREHIASVEARKGENNGVQTFGSAGKSNRLLEFLETQSRGSNSNNAIDSKGRTNRKNGEISLGESESNGIGSSREGVRNKRIENSLREESYPRTFTDSLTEPTKYQTRDGSTTDYVTSRLALADAFEQIATNQRERNWAARYRERAEELAGYNTRLRELWKDYFTKGHSAAERAEIRTQIRSLTQKIQTADGGGSKEKQGVKNTLFLNLQAAYSSDL